MVWNWDKFLDEDSIRAAREKAKKVVSRDGALDQFSWRKEWSKMLEKIKLSLDEVLASIIYNDYKELMKELLIEFRTWIFHVNEYLKIFRIHCCCQEMETGWVELFRTAGWPGQNGSISNKKNKYIEFFGKFLKIFFLFQWNFQIVSKILH